MRRRTLLIGAGVTAAGTALVGSTGRYAFAQDDSPTEFDYVLGSDDAPVTVIEYASFTCPHCAAFHADTLPQLKTNYIDTGQVRMVFRHFPLNGLDLQAGMMATCLGEDLYLRIADVLFSTQQDWMGSSDQLAALSRIARQAGLSEDAFNQCVNDQELAERIVASRQQAIEAYGVQSTPTIFINGRAVMGAAPYEVFDEIVRDELDRAQ